MTDEQLAICFKAEGSNEAFGELYSRHYSRLYHYCYSILGDANEAADIAQDTFAKAAEKISHLRSPALFLSWLFRVAHNACIDQAKGRRRHPTVSTDSSLQLAEETFDLEDAMDKEKAIDSIGLLLEKLSPEAKSILIAKYCDGRSIQELTQLCGISESAVKMRLCRARNRVLSLYRKQAVAN